MDVQVDAWLVDYQQNGSEDAFAYLVERYLPLVSACAARRARGEPLLVEDIVQRVFIDFARKAKRMKPGGSLGGWLHRHTCFVAGTVMRGERRRRAREEQSEVEMTESDSAWRQISPIVDAAVDALGQKDRLAVVLRYFEQRDLRTVGAALGVTEDAAQKRVARALEKLRAVLVCRGVVLSAGALAGALANSGASAAPVISATAVATAALATAGASLSGFSVGNLIMMSKAKLALAAMVAAGIGTTVIVKHLTAIESEKTSLKNRAAQLEAASVAAGADQTVIRAEIERLRADQRDAIKLRGDVVRLRQQIADANAALLAAQKAALTAEAKNRAATATPEPAEVPEIRTFQSQAHAVVKSGDSVILSGWPTGPGKVTFALVTPSALGLSQVEIGARLVEMPIEAAASSPALAGLEKVTNAVSILRPDQVRSLLEAWKQTPEINIVNAPTMTISSGRPGQISVEESHVIPNGSNPGAVVNSGPVFKVTPTLSADGSINLELVATLTQLLKPTIQSLSVAK
jgi:RNA polymerase sigma factor (sigma-70 family)